MNYLLKNLIVIFILLLLTSCASRSTIKNPCKTPPKWYMNDSSCPRNSLCGWSNSSSSRQVTAETNAKLRARADLKSQITSDVFQQLEDTFQERQIDIDDGGSNLKSLLKDKFLGKVEGTIQNAKLLDYESVDCGNSYTVYASVYIDRKGFNWLDFISESAEDLTESDESFIQEHVQWVKDNINK